MKHQTTFVKLLALVCGLALITACELEQEPSVDLPDGGQQGGPGQVIELPDPVDDLDPPLTQLPRLALAASDAEQQLFRLLDMPNFAEDFFQSDKPSPWLAHWQRLEQDAYALRQQPNSVWPSTAIYLSFKVQQPGRLAQLSHLTYGVDRQTLDLADNPWLRPNAKDELQLVLELTAAQWQQLCPKDEGSQRIYLHLHNSSQTPSFDLDCATKQERLAVANRQQTIRLGDATLLAEPVQQVSYWLIDAQQWQQQGYQQQLADLLDQLRQQFPQHQLCLMPYRTAGTGAQLLPCALERADSLSLAQQWQRLEHASENHWQGLSYLQPLLAEHSHASTLVWLPGVNLVANFDYQQLEQALQRPATRLLNLQQPQTQAVVSAQARRLALQQSGASYFWQPPAAPGSTTALSASYQAVNWQDFLADVAGF